MTTSAKISAVIGILQVHEKLHEVLRLLLQQHTNDGFMVARSGQSAAEKWNALEAARRDLLAALQLVAAQHGIALPAHLKPRYEEEDHAAD